LALQRIDAQLTEIEVSEGNTHASLAIERRSLELMESNLEDRRRLLDQGTLSSMQFDDEERATLAQSLRVQELENTLQLIPTQRAQLETQREQANLDLARTEITAPFDCRITATQVDLDQFVNVGQILVEADGIATAEVPAQFFINHMRQLIRAAGLEEIPLTSEGLADLSSLGLTALVRLPTAGFAVEWDARVDRFSPEIDLQTRTIGVIVAVDDPYKRAIPGEQPPLFRGMYCEVEIRGRPIPDTVVIPRAALHAADVVHVVNGEGRLEIRPVEVEFHQSNLTAVRANLMPGEVIVVSDLIPAIEGMLIEPREDSALAQSLLAEATGQTSVR
jgi:multidrug efflux pump subunit AcrA (membrane-fusion protein)